MHPQIPDRLYLAPAAILLTCLALSLGDALIKQQSASFLLWQIFLVRSLIALPFLVYLIRLTDCATTMMPARLGWTLLRSLILVVMWLFYFIALSRVEFALAAAAFYTLPIFIALFAAWFLKNKIPAAGWLAVVLGFCGALLILQPQADGFSLYALLPLISAICYAGAMILTRSKCQHEKPLVLSLWLNLAFVFVAAIALLILAIWEPSMQQAALQPFLLGDWKIMGLDEWRNMAILAIVIVVASVAAAYAYQKAPSSLVASFDLSYLPLVVLWGILFFDEIPGPEMLVGIVLIVGAGLIALRSAVRLD